MRQLPIVLTALSVLAVAPLYSDDKPAAQDARAAAEGTRDRAVDAMKDKDVTYGRVKELTAEKVVIDVDDAIDKNFDLTDKDLTVNMAKGLKVGDPVKIKETSTAGKTTSVTIAKHAGGGVTHGDKDPAKKP